MAGSGSSSEASLSSGDGKALGCAAECGDGVAGLDPPSVAGDSDRDDVEAVTIGGPEDVQRRNARHFVFGRASTEQHHETYSVGSTHNAIVRSAR